MVQIIYDKKLPKFQAPSDHVHWTVIQWPTTRIVVDSIVITKALEKLLFYRGSQKMKTSKPPFKKLFVSGGMMVLLRHWIHYSFVFTFSFLFIGMVISRSVSRKLQQSFQNSAWNIITLGIKFRKILKRTTTSAILQNKWFNFTYIAAL